MTYITSPSYTEQLLTAYDVSDVAGDARSILGNFTDVMLGGSTPAMSPPPNHLLLPTHNQPHNKTHHHEVPNTKEH
jgi:hypothetical protein